MKKISFQALLPHLVALSVFLVVTLIFFYPMILDGKVMTQHDMVQGISSGQEVRDFRAETGKEALWTNSMFGGMPAYLINVYWNGDLSGHLHNLLSLYLPSPARYAFLGMICFYLLLLTFKVNPFVAIAGAIAYGINSFTMVSIEAGHIWKVSAITYMPLVLAGINLIMRKKALLGIALTATSVALLIRTNHIQIAYYLFFILLAFWIVYLIDAIKKKDIPSFGKATAFIALAGALGLSTNFGKLWASAEYGAYTIRGKSELKANTQSTSGGLDRDYAFRWSNGISESFTFMIPYFYGGASAESVSMKSKFAKEMAKAGVNRTQIRSIAERIPTYWGDQPFVGGPIYPGVIVVFLFVLGIFTVKGPVRNWLVAATLLGFALSWGSNFSSFNYLMFDYFPLYNKFRAVSMALVIPIFCLPILGFLGLSEFLKNPDKKILFKTIGIVGGLLLLFLISSAFMGFRSPNDASITQQVFLDAIISQRKSMFQGSTMRSLFVVIAAGSLLYFLSQKKLKLVLFASLMSVLVLFDLYSIDKKYIAVEKFSRAGRATTNLPDEADSRILSDTGHHRVINLTVSPFNDATTSQHHLSVGGYHGAKLRRYNDLIDYHLGQEIQHSITQIQAGTYNITGIPALNMLNTKYLKLGPNANAVLSNTGALGNAWFVSQLKSVSNPDEAIAEVGISDLRSTAISEQLPDQTGLSLGTITLAEYKPNFLRYQTSNLGNGFAVFSEIYYEKGWKAFIDGEEAPIQQVNYVLRGLNIPAGEHSIEFKFEPDAYYVGNSIMWIGSIVTLGLLLFALISDGKKIMSN
ncbi:MAG: YfhO family protein [Cyclobacteriaceae bacterium]